MAPMIQDKKNNENDAVNNELHDRSNSIECSQKTQQIQNAVNTRDTSNKKISSLVEMVGNTIRDTPDGEIEQRIHEKTKSEETESTTNPPLLVKNSPQV
jgi:hypothetical protein